MKKVLFYAFLLPAFVGMMFSCSDVKTDVKKLEGKWNVVEVKGEKVLEEGLPQMDFNMAEKKLHGNTGCNLFNTTITLDPEDVSSITIAPGAQLERETIQKRVTDACFNRWIRFVP